MKWVEKWNICRLAVLIVTLVMGTVPVGAAENGGKMPFSDVKEEAFYHDAVTWAYSEGIVAGTGKNTFSPNQKVSRADLVTMLHRYAEKAGMSVSGNSMAMPFSDVTVKSDGTKPYYYDGVAWAFSNAITKGVAETTFGPRVTCTRGQAITFLYNMKGKPAVTTASPFLDCGEGAYYEKAALWAYERDITSGKTRYLFGTWDQVTRAEAVCWLYRLDRNKEEKSIRVLTQAAADTLPRSYGETDLSAEFDYRYVFTHCGDLVKSLGNDPATVLRYYAETGRFHGMQATEDVPAGEKAKIICIDPGHQDHGMSAMEQNGPGSDVRKAKLTTGTSGWATGRDEYMVNLEVSLKLRDELRKRGYTVVMTRETNHVNISNIERAQIANAAGADIFVRMHCNGAETGALHGALTMAPADDNPYLTAGIIKDSQRLAQTLLDHQVRFTGQKKFEVQLVNNMTGINWARMPVTIVEMGYMSNHEEDRYLSSTDGQNKIASGLADGIDAYFAGRS